MLSVRTNDEWAGVEIGIDDGSTTSAYTVQASANSVKDAMDALVTWATSTFAPTFSWAWARDTATGGAKVEISATADFDLTANSAGQALLGFAASYSGGPRYNASAAGVGTWDTTAQLSIRQSLGVLPADGSAGGAGTCRPGVPGLSLHPVVIDTIATPLECGRLAHVLITAAHPRGGWIYQEHSSTWRLVALGAVNKGRTAGNLWRVGFDAFGGLE